MNLKMKDLFIIALVVLVSFPAVFFGVLVYTGNARVEFGPKKRSPEEEKKVELFRQSAQAESLSIVNSRAFQAARQERAALEKERVRLLEERERLDLFSRDLEARKNELEKTRERIEKLVSKSDTLEKKKSIQLSKMYSAMRPAEAAQIIGTLNDDLAARILDGISDDRQKAKILAALGGDKAMRITQRMGGAAKAKHDRE